MRNSGRSIIAVSLFIFTSTVPLATAQRASVRIMPDATWTADNGNGTFTNPILYEDFPDPDIIRVGEDFYMTGSSMHMMPGLPVLHSRDLVNWTLLSYAFDRLDLGPEYRLEAGKEAYGMGIWAPAIRHHNGTFYIFSNINGYGLQVFTATNPAGPWTRRSLGSKVYDLGVLFDDDGHIYAVHGYNEVRLIELKPDLTGFVEGSDRMIIPGGNGMGEGHHFYKIKGKYYIISANYAPVGRMQAARADNPYGPYETVTISARETMGWERGWTLQNNGWGPLPKKGQKVPLRPQQGNEVGPVPMHQGGIVDLPNGDWWGWSMMNNRSMGRATYLSPVTWKDGWPYFGLPGNLGRSPKTWLKPATSTSVIPTPTFSRNDDFSKLKMGPVWQWNHYPQAGKWSLSERRGRLRLHTLPASDFMTARNTLTQKAIGPESTATTLIDAKRLKEGDVAGLGLLGLPYYYVALTRSSSGIKLRMYDSLNDEVIEAAIPGTIAHLRVMTNFDRDVAQFSYSTDGGAFQPIGGEMRLAWQLKTFQGVRYALFAFNENGKKGGFADFDSFSMAEPFADRSANLPVGKSIIVRNLADGRPFQRHELGLLYFVANESDTSSGKPTEFRMRDRGQGRVVLEAVDGSGFLTVFGEGLAGDVRLAKVESADSLFQWQDMLAKQFMLLSLKTNRYLGLDPGTNEPYSADWPGAEAGRKNGTVFTWEAVLQ